MRALISFSFLILLLSCGGGDDDELLDINPSNNACNVLGIEPLDSKLYNSEYCSNAISSGIVSISPVIFTVDGSISLSLCSGAIISSRHILTSAHCFDSFLPLIDGYIVRVGNSNSNIIPVSRVYIPRAYNGEVASSFDIAVVELSRETTAPALPLLLSRSAKEGDIATAFGFGSDGRDNQGLLQAVNFSISEKDDGNFVANFSEVNSGICSGDSGGPLVQNIDGVRGIIGVNSFGSYRESEGTQECTDVNGEISGFLNIQRQEILDFIFAAAPNANAN